MVAPYKFLDALSLLPELAWIRRQAKFAWDGNVPVQLDFALVGGQIANHFRTFTDDEKAYIRGVLIYGLSHGSRHLRKLVLQPLLSTLFERSRRLGMQQEAAIFLYLYGPNEGDVSQSD